MSLRTAQRLVPKSTAGLVVTQEEFITEDIIELWLDRAKEDFSYLRPWIQEMDWKNENDLKKIYTWVYENITYVDDTEYYGDEWQIIKSPAETLHSGKADCKSLSLLLKAILDNLPEPVAHIGRFVWYKWHDYYKHVYLIAVLRSGLERPLDTVYATEKGRNMFGREIKDIHATKDFKFKAKKMPLAKLGTIQAINPAAMTEGELALTLKQRELTLINSINKNTDLNRAIELLEVAKQERKNSKQLGCQGHFLCQDIDEAAIKQESANTKHNSNNTNSEQWGAVEIPNPHKYPPLFQNSPQYQAALQAYETQINELNNQETQEQDFIEQIENFAPSMIRVFSEDDKEQQAAFEQVQTIAESAGISTENTIQIIRNGILKATEQQPETILQNLPGPAVDMIEAQTTAPALQSDATVNKTFLDNEKPTGSSETATPESNNNKKLGWLKWLLVIIAGLFGIKKIFNL